MKVLLFGADGQVGWELQRSLLTLGDVHACTRDEANLEDPKGLRRLIRVSDPDVIVNAAAYTAVDKAESEQRTAYRVNAESVGVIAEEVKRLNGLLVHYSTDYVFDGEKSAPYVEDDRTNPKSVYGLTKVRGEEAIKESGCEYLVYRTSWVYSNRRVNFPLTMLRLAKDRDELRVVSDQIGVPTCAKFIADVTSFCLYGILGKGFDGASVSGIYHLVPSGETSWYDLVRFILTEAENNGCQLRVNLKDVYPIKTSDYPLPASRPLNSRMETKKLTALFRLRMPPWQFHVKRLVKELC